MQGKPRREAARRKPEESAENRGNDPEERRGQRHLAHFSEAANASALVLLSNVEMYEPKTQPLSPS